MTMRILYMSDADLPGGTLNYLGTLLHHASTSQHLTLALPPRATSLPIAAQASALGVRVLPFEPGAAPPRPADLARALQLLRQHQPELLHLVLANPRHCSAVLLAAALLRIPRRIVTFQLVTPVPSFRGLGGLARRINRSLQYRTLHHGIAVSRGNQRLLIEEYGFPAARLALIPNGVNLRHFQPRPDDGQLRQQYRIPPAAPLLGVIGQLGSQKGHRVLLDALPHIWQAAPDTHVLFAGSGAHEARLRRQADSIAAAGRVIFAGQQADVRPLLAALDLVVLPSLYEGLPFVVLEALAMARPVVASDVDGSRELIDDQRTGLLVPPAVPTALAAAVTRLLADPPLRARLGQAGHTHVTLHYDERTMVEQTFALYSSYSPIPGTGGFKK